jgi:RNA polymerase sigma-70 factor, ECF subfamily
VGTPSKRETIFSDAQTEFARLYAEVRPRVHRYLARRVGESDAEDLTQIVFLKASQALPGFRGAAALSTWLTRIADHAATDWLRGRRVRIQPCQGTDDGSACVDQPDSALRADEVLIRLEMTGCIREVVEGVPEPYRRVLVMSELEGVSNAGIAAALGVSLPTVKIRLHRARSMLQKALEARCTLSRDARQGLACDVKPSA